jgi:hypothetical protein
MKLRLRNDVVLVLLAPQPERNESGSACDPLPLGAHACLLVREAEIAAVISKRDVSAEVA